MAPPQPDIPPRFLRAARRHRRMRRLQLVLLAVALLLILIAVPSVLLLPRFATRLANRKLAGLGLPGASVRVSLVTPRRAVLGPIRLGEGAEAPAADRAVLHYTLSGLRAGRIDALTLSGLSGTLARSQQGTWSLAGLDGFRLPPASPEAPAFSLGRLEIGDGTLRLRGHGVPETTIPFEGRAERAADGRYRLAGTVRPLGDVVAVEAELDASSLSGSAQLGSDHVTLESWHAFAAHLAPGVAAVREVRGTAALSVQALFGDGRLNWAHAEAHGEEPALHAAVADPANPMAVELTGKGLSATADLVSGEDGTRRLSVEASLGEWGATMQGESGAEAHGTALSVKADLAPGDHGIRRLSAEVSLGEWGVTAQRPEGELAAQGKTLTASGRAEMGDDRRLHGVEADIAATAVQARAGGASVSMPELRLAWRAPGSVAEGTFEGSATQAQGTVADGRIGPADIAFAGSLKDIRVTAARLPFEWADLAKGVAGGEATLVQGAAGWTASAKTDVTGLTVAGRPVTLGPVTLGLSAQGLTARLDDARLEVVPGLRATNLAVQVKRNGEGTTAQASGMLVVSPAEACRRWPEVKVSGPEVAFVLLASGTLPADGSAATGSLSLRDGRGELSVGVGGVNLRAAVQAGLAIAWTDRGPVLSADAAASGLETAAGNTAFRAEMLSLRLERAEFPEPRALARLAEEFTLARLLALVHATGQLDVANGTVLHGEALSVDGVAAAVPFVWSGARGFAAATDGSVRPVTLSAQAAHWRGVAVKPVRLACTLEGWRATAAGRVELSDGSGGATVDGDLIFTAPAGLRTRLQGQIPDLAKAGWLLPLLPEGPLRKASLAGAAAVEADLFIDRLGPAGVATVQLRDGGFALAKPKISIEKAEAEIIFRELFPPRTETHQALRFAAAQVVGLPFDNGEVYFQIDAPRALFIERSRIGWCGGVLTTHAVEMAPGAPEFAVTVYAEHIDLARVFALQSRLTGEVTGELYGKLPFAVRDGRLYYEEGFLYSVPGRKGRLRLSETKAMADSLGLPAGDPRVGQAEAALEDLEYSLLKLDIAGEGELTHLRIQVEGQSVSQPELPPVKLNANIEANVNELIGAGALVNRINLQGK